MVNYATYADVFAPSVKKYAGLYNVTLIIAGSLLIALCAQIAIPLPFSPVPVTGQTFAILMVGALLGAKRGSLAVLAYLAEGVAGLPVFSLARGGVMMFAGPTAGYLFGFVVAAYIVGFLAERGWDRRISTTIFTMILGLAVIYGFGVLWLSVLFKSFNAALAFGFYPFMIGEVLKVSLAALLLPVGWKFLKK